MEKSERSENDQPLKNNKTISSSILSIAGWILPIVFIYYFMGRGLGGMSGMMGGKPGAGGAGGRGGIFGFGQSTARIIKENTGVTFKYLYEN